MIEIQYSVHWADFEPAPLPEDDTVSFLDLPEAECSDVIDERTWRAKIFNLEHEAIAFGEGLIKERLEQNDKWLATVEVRRHTHEVVRKVK